MDWRREWQPTPVLLPGKSHAFGPVTLWQIDGERLGRVTDYFLGLQNHCKKKKKKKKQKQKNKITADDDSSQEFTTDVQVLWLLGVCWKSETTELSNSCLLPPAGTEYIYVYLKSGCSSPE